MAARHFGHVPGYPPGSTFSTRQELSAAGVHRPTQAGISGSERDGADSIVLSGGYEDDFDDGSVILYTGHGGRGSDGAQVEHQRLNRGNLALAKSRLDGLPVRVIRGAGHASRYGPKSGYRYDGLYYVTDYFYEVGVAGYYVWRFVLRTDRLGESIIAEDAAAYGPAPRRDVLGTRLMRNSAITHRVKTLHDFQCQVCGERLETIAGPYAEAAHIQPLGSPFDGPDVLENVLCLCPNHHVLFDLRAFTIDDSFELVGLPGVLRTHPKHSIGIEYLRHHQHRYTGSSTTEL